MPEVRSFGLLGMLRDAYPDSVHVVDVELDAATDREIWEYAGEHDLIVVSKDSDFRQLAFQVGDGEPACRRGSGREVR